MSYIHLGMQRQYETNKKNPMLHCNFMQRDVCYSLYTVMAYHPITFIPLYKHCRNTRSSQTYNLYRLQLVFWNAWVTEYFGELYEFSFPVTAVNVLSFEECYNLWCDVRVARQKFTDVSEEFSSCTLAVSSAYLRSRRQRVSTFPQYVCERIPDYTTSHRKI
jgi:hypothetical protein